MHCQSRWITDWHASERWPHYTRANAGEVLPDPASPLGAQFSWERGMIPGRRDAYVQSGNYSLDEFDEDRPQVVMMGGGGKRVLTTCGEMADIVSINFNNKDGKIGAVGIGSSTAAMTSQKIGWIRDGAGDRFDEVEIEIGGYFAAVTDQTTATLDMWPAHWASIRRHWPSTPTPLSVRLPKFARRSRPAASNTASAMSRLAGATSK